MKKLLRPLSLLLIAGIAFALPAKSFSTDTATPASSPTPSPASSPPSEPSAAVQDIRDAFTLGGPLISCWNVQAGWNLAQQVQWIKEGHRYFPAIYCPLLQQGANSQRKWDDFYAEYGDELAYINQNKLPVTLRWHNFGAGFYDAEVRPPIESSALVWRRLPDGTLDDRKLIDHLAPAEPWANEGKLTAASLWMANLAAALPDVPRFYLLENNEAALAELGYYTTPRAQKDQWKYPLRQWRPNMGTLSVRMEQWAATHSADELEPAVEAGFVRVHKAFWDAFFAAMPASMQGKSYSGGYGGLGEYNDRGLGAQTWSYKRPQENWNQYPWSHAIWEFNEPSDRVYDDGSGSPWNWHDWVRGPHILQHNTAPLGRYLSETRGSLWHNDQSVWISPQRCRVAATDHGGYVLPERAKGFYRAIAWSVINRGRADVQRYFAASQTELTNQWFDASADPPELAHLTEADYFNVAMQAVDEVWDNPLLLLFWRAGEPVLNPDPPLCLWELPASIGDHAIVDDRSRVLYTDADPPRFQGGKDTWRAIDGKGELKVFAQAYRVQGLHLIFAWSPRMTRDNVTVQVPGLGGVKFPIIDQDGEFIIAPSSVAIH